MGVIWNDNKLQIPRMKVEFIVCCENETTVCKNIQCSLCSELIQFHSVPNVAPQTTKNVLLRQNES